MKNKLKEKAKQLPPVKKQYEFIDKANVPGRCSVLAPGERFEFAITRLVAENLLVKHGYNLPFDIMRPWEGDDDWVGVTADDLDEGKLDKDWEQFEIWLPIPNI